MCVSLFICVSVCVSSTLESLIGHLSAVSLHGGVTGMTAKNLAIVWAPNLVRSVELEAASGVAALQVNFTPGIDNQRWVRFELC